MLDGRPKLRNLRFWHAAQAKPLGFEMHLHKDAPEMHEGRNRGGNQQGCQRDIEKFNHHKGRSPHDGWGDLPTRTRRRLHSASEMRLIANALHGGDGQRTGGDGIRNGRTANGAEHSGRYNSDLGRPARITPSHDCCQINEELAKPHARGEHAE